jgi:hypothetical protein
LPSAGKIQAHDELVALGSHGVSPHAKAPVHGAAARCDLEVPLVPRAADERVRVARGQLAVPHLDPCDDLAPRAQGRAAVGAAVRESMKPAVDAEDGHASPADLDDPDSSGRRGLGQRDASFARPAGVHAETGVGRR